MKCIGRTRRCIRIILWEVHLGLEIPAVVERVRVEDDESNVPIEDVIVMELKTYSSVTVNVKWPDSAHFHVDPLLWGQHLVLVHEDAFSHDDRLMGNWQVGCGLR